MTQINIKGTLQVIHTCMHACNACSILMQCHQFTFTIIIHHRNTRRMSVSKV